MLTKGVRFHHDNARPHTANRTTALVERFGWEMVSHQPYSPDLAPSDFHLFPELKKNLGGTQFQTDEEVQNAVVNFLHGQAAEFYHSGLKSGCLECRNAYNATAIM
ncbi:histone-lysine N-methyltransferase SETMAR [Trichonephila clavipes]|nr:histone-lysine N-methyltransferase SETMAR [Trichonephila clavipes]